MPDDKFPEDYSRFLDSDGRHLTYAALSTYRNSADLLSRKESAFLRTHLNSCRECQGRLRDVEEVEEEAEGVPAEEKARAIPLVFRYAIAAVVVIGFGLAALYLPRYLKQNKTPEKSLAYEAPDPQRFRPNDVLENFVSRTTRSADAVSFIAPKGNDTLSMPFTFKWEDSRARRGYTLSVVDNKNHEIWTSSGNLKETSVGGVPSPGLYYAKLLADGELLVVTRFVVAEKRY